MNESPVLLHVWSVHPEQESTLVAQLAEMFSRVAGDPGYVSARILGSEDHTSVAAVVEMRSAEDRRRLEQLPEVHDTLYNVEGAYNLAVRLYHEAAAVPGLAAARARDQG